MAVDDKGCTREAVAVERCCASDGSPGAGAQCGAICQTAPTRRTRRDCGKKIEATQPVSGGSLIGNVIKRDGSLLAVMVPLVSRHFCSKTNRARRGRTSVSTATTQRRIWWCCTGLQADKLDFVLVHRETKSTTELPNELFFNSEAATLVTIDFARKVARTGSRCGASSVAGPARGTRVCAAHAVDGRAGVSWGAAPTDRGLHRRAGATPQSISISATRAGRCCCCRACLAWTKDE